MLFMSIFLSPTCTWVWIPFGTAGVGERNEVCLTLHFIVEGIKADHVPHLTLNAWYLDDVILVGSPEDLADALSITGKVGANMVCLFPLCPALSGQLPPR